MKNRLLTDKKEIIDIIRRSQWCHMAMNDPDGKPYVLPFNFGFRNDVIYMHGSQKGKKIDLLKNNPAVCINFSIDHVLKYQSEQVACSWSMKFRSVLCYGRVEFIDEFEGKTAALDIIMSQYSDRKFTYNPPSLREVCVWKVVVEKFEGKVYGY
jgi:nitroimidazol reductase NimA-like FMN-containing flavoprotein (pyridoxamine 5'-phosphate oxidase superfamily)